MSEKYKIGESHIPHFITLTIIDWVDVFTRPVYFEIIINSLKYCQGEKGLRIYAYCIMTNHIHIIASSEQNNMSEIIRDFKKFTSKKLINAIKLNTESRRHWMLKIFEYAAERIKRGKNFKVWKDGFHPLQLDTDHSQEMTMAYIHNNPVKAGFVKRPEDYTYSSASFFINGETLIDIELID